MSFFGQALNNTSEQSVVSLFCVVMRSFTYVQNDKFANNVNIGSTAILLPIFIDNENMAVVDSLLQQGLPEGLSAESYKTIWIVIDHASLEKQEQHLSHIEQMTLRGLVDRDNYAILFDRIAMKRNRPQRYGSQSVQ